jgi:hypothetical protein
MLNCLGSYLVLLLLLEQVIVDLNVELLISSALGSRQPLTQLLLRIVEDIDPTGLQSAYHAE